MDNEIHRKRLLESLDRGPGTVHRVTLEEGIIQESTSRGAYAHGPFRQWFPGGQLRIERQYRAGLLHGVCRQFAEDGRLLTEFVMNDGDGLFLEYWDNGKMKVRWWHFHLQDEHCGIMECYDNTGVNATRSYTLNGAPCRTKKRFVAELGKRGLVLPPPDKMDDPVLWADFARKARGVCP